MVDETSTKTQLLTYIEQLEKQLQNSQASENQISLAKDKFRSIFLYVPHAIVLYRQNDEKQLIVDDFNIAAIVLLDIEEDILGFSPEQAFPDINSEIITALHNSIQLKQSWHKEEIIYENNKVKAAYDTSVFHFSSAHAAVMIQDITEQKQYLDELNTLNDTLEQRINERTKELTIAHQKLLEQAHLAGMAQIATNVLHNVGNLLNSVGFDIGEISNIQRNSVIKKLFKANELLTENLDSLNEFILHNPRGKQLLNFYLAIELEIKQEQSKLSDINLDLIKTLKSINDVIKSQMHIASGASFSEKINMEELILDILKTQKPLLQSFDIQFIPLLENVSPIYNQKSKLVHILSNLIINAKDALLKQNNPIKEITVELLESTEYLIINISDTGVGIPPENLTKIFQHGFTTKETGFGFGLHSCANYIHEMKGTIEVKSDGIGKGATFTLTLPKKL